MKICVSEFTYKTFESILKENFPGDEFLLIDSEANIIMGEGKPDVALVSYELMFKALKSDTFFTCLLYTSPSPRDLSTSRMPSSA